MNAKVVEILLELGNLYELKGEKFRAGAYKRAAAVVGNLTQDIATIKDPTSLPKIGKSVAAIIIEVVQTGSSSKLEELRAKSPPATVNDLRKIPGIGPKTAMKLWKEQNIGSLEDFRQAVDGKRITDPELIKGLEYVERSLERTPIADALQTLLPIYAILEELPSVSHIEIVGSTRRGGVDGTIGDGDLIIVTSDRAEVTKAFTGVADEVRIAGDSKVRIVKNDLQIDLIFVPGREWGSYLLHSTGSAQFNIACRKLAISKGWRLSEHGLFDENDQLMPCETEEEILETLGLPWIPPQLREQHIAELIHTQGTVRSDQLPLLIEEIDIKGTLHNHINDHGVVTVDEYIDEGIRRGYEYIGLTPHSKTLAIAGGNTEEDIKRCIVYTKLMNARYGDKIRILQSAEVEVKADGSLDYDDRLLQELDYVVFSIHTRKGIDYTTKAERVMRHLYQLGVVAIWAHPTGRDFGKRGAAEADWDKLFQIAAETGTLLEINSLPSRLDLLDSLVWKARQYGCKFVISTDTHYIDNMNLVSYGITVAQRGGCTPDDIVNTKDWRTALRRSNVSS